MRLHPGEFENYRIGVDADITFCLKEARAILAFSDFAAQPVNIHFAAPGKPVVFSLDGDSLYLADFVLATLMEHSISSQGSQPAEATMERAANTIKPRPTKIKKGAGSHKSSKDAKKALEESDIPVEVTCDEDALNAVDLRSLSTPPYNANKTARKGSEHNTESHGNEEDDFFSESFPYKGIAFHQFESCSEHFRSKNYIINPNPQSQSGYGEDPVLQVKGYVDSQNKSVLSADVSLPFVGNSVTPQNEMPKTNFDVCDDVLPSTPPSKKFKSIFFGTVTSPAEIRKRGKRRLKGEKEELREIGIVEGEKKIERGKEELREIGIVEGEKKIERGKEELREIGIVEGEKKIERGKEELRKIGIVEGEKKIERGAQRKLHETVLAEDTDDENGP
eukprot:gene15384-6618_t